MRFWKDLSYSLIGAVLITCFSVVFYTRGGELLAIPGIILEGWLNLLIILVSDDPYISLNRAWLLFNLLFYSLLIFCFLSLARWIRLRI
jgi:hypothetical protein